VEEEEGRASVRFTYAMWRKKWVSNAGYNIARPPFSYLFLPPFLCSRENANETKDERRKPPGKGEEGRRKRRFYVFTLAFQRLSRV